MLPLVRIEELAGDREHGASFLARRAVEILIDSADTGDDPVEVARALAAARPAMGAISGAVGRVVAAAHGPEQVVQEGTALLASYVRAPRSIAVLLQETLRGCVVTLSTSATVAEAVAYATPQRVVLAVSGREEDALASADVVLVGADTVFRDGSIVNAAGTRALAEAAASVGVPVLVAAETLKLVPTEPGAPKDDGFDLTPAHPIDRIVTEEGSFEPDEIEALVDRTPFLREGFELVSGAHVL